MGNLEDAEKALAYLEQLAKDKPTPENKLAAEHARENFAALKKALGVKEE